MPSAFPARLHVLLARSAPTAVVLRRGPSRSVCSLLWDRRADAFRLGQWLRGRIYERRADLSPDGRYLIYFAMNGRWKGEAGGAWTAVSRAPWLKAISLWAKGDCWHGGGMFVADDRYWLNAGCGHRAVREAREVRRDALFRPAGGYGGECPSVYYPRLLRDGWTLADARDKSCFVFEKRLGWGWILRKRAHAEIGAPPGRGCYWDEHELEHPATGKRAEHPSWEWADLDGDRLVWAEAGRLHAAAIRRSIGEPRLLHDFNDMMFEPRVAPY
ncbi:MAG TPA: hypothetical protein VKE22_01660 [Haliangiales bacterium]|nr:hypothetical protein [Haliangiales bacterium]